MARDLRKNAHLDLSLGTPPKPIPLIATPKSFATTHFRLYDSTTAYPHPLSYLTRSGPPLLPRHPHKMLDVIDFITERGGNPELIRKSQAARHAPVEIVDEIIALYNEARTGIAPSHTTPRLGLGR